MAKKLVSFVHVNGSVYGPEDDVPTEDAALITNPRAWGEEPKPQPAQAEAAPVKKAPAKKAASSKTDK